MRLRIFLFYRHRPERTTLMIRIRTIKEAITEIKDKDPMTKFSEHNLRRMLKEGVLPYFKAGNRSLINMDLLEQYLANPIGLQTINNNVTGIRRIEVSQ